MLQQNTSDKQNAHYVRDLESIVESYKTRPPMQYRSTLIKKDTNSRTSNLFINSKRESIRRARESFYIDKAKTMQPRGKKMTINLFFPFFIIVFSNFKNSRILIVVTSYGRLSPELINNYPAKSRGILNNYWTRLSKIS